MPTFAVHLPLKVELLSGLRRQHVEHFGIQIPLRQLREAVWVAAARPIGDPVGYGFAVPVSNPLRIGQVIVSSLGILLEIEADTSDGLCRTSFSNTRLEGLRFRKLTRLDLALVLLVLDDHGGLVVVWKSQPVPRVDGGAIENQLPVVGLVELQEASLQLTQVGVTMLRLLLEAGQRDVSDDRSKICIHKQLRPYEVERGFEHVLALVVAGG
mmetsp:Transcript_28482/g.62152  ORF Transcript_28482/g.62152 Transcript_28482/m.62152 type:complete len:212 (+) Transcript_28482:2-637(+)